MSAMAYCARTMLPLLFSLTAGSWCVEAQLRSDSTLPPRVTVLPVVGSAPETGFQYGATVLRLYRLGPAVDTRVSQQQVYAIYTAHSQARAFVQLDRWSLGNEWRVRARGEYQRFPLPFYGIGDAAPWSAEEWYTSSGPSAQLLVQRRIASALFVGGGARVNDVRIRDIEPGRALGTGTVLGAQGGTVAQLQGFVARDTRDHILAARQGQLVQLTAMLAGGAIGSDYDFGRFALDARQFWSPGQGEHVIAAQLLLEGTSRRAPFDQLVQVGSDTALRGYTRGRYRDRQGANAQVEYRSPYVRRVGLVAFAGAGMVAPSLRRFDQAKMFPSVGVGLRALLVPAQRASIRIDYGRGRGTSGLYVALNEAF